MTIIGRFALGAVLAATVSASAVAADLPRNKVAPVAPVVDTWSPWMIRVRALAVLPDSSAKVYLNGAQIPNASAKVSNSIVPEVDITYFFTKNIAVEAICCVTPHKVTAKGSIAALGEIGKTVVFPPTVLLQYHFDGMGAFKPYVGVGVNYTHYFKNGTGANFSELKIKDSWGVAAQIGFDYMINRNWGINVDVKKVMMQPDANITVAPGVLAPTAVPVTAKVKIDPWLVSTGVTYRF